MLNKQDLLILRIQTAYFLLTGIWPILHIRSFMEITGYKTDQWLVKTVGLLILSVSSVMVVSLIKKRMTEESYSCLLSASIFLTCIDMYYAINDTIKDIYLLDAVVETGFIAYWMIRFRRIFGRSKEQAKQ